MSKLSLTICLVAIIALVQDSVAHTVITYPGWRGDNLHSSGTVNDTNGLGSLALDNGTILFPFGMQWQYPCKDLAATPSIHVLTFSQVVACPCRRTEPNGQ